MARREKISSVDTAWLRMDRPSNLMMICGVLILRERVALRQVERMITGRFLRFPRFRQRAVQLPGVAYWEDDPHFDLSSHVKRDRLPGKAGKDELQKRVSELMATPLDSSRPMWQFHLIEKYGAGSALVARIHHSYADGIALIQVMLSMTDPTAHATSDGATEGDADNGRGAGGDNALFAPLAGLWRTASKWGNFVLERGAEVWADPAKAVELAGKGSAFTDEVIKLVRMGEDSTTRFKGMPGVAKCVAWAEPISLADVKAVGRALGCSVNDVLLASVAGALRGYLVAHGDAVDEVMMRAAVPVNLRPLEKAWRLGNKFGLVFLDLPIGIGNPIARLYAVRANMNALKGSYQPVLTIGLLAALGAGPKMVQDQILTVLSRNATAVMTNVPGPPQPLFLAGSRIENLMFWVPQSGNIGMGVSILSYDGKVQFGLVTDAGLCPDPEEVIARFAPEFEKLLLTALLAPWEGTLDAATAEDVVAAFVAGPDPPGRRKGEYRSARRGGKPV